MSMDPQEAALVRAERERIHGAPEPQKETEEELRMRTVAHEALMMGEALLAELNIVSYPNRPLTVAGPPVTLTSAEMMAYRLGQRSMYDYIASLIDRGKRDGNGV